jgi:hypothetical protein
VVLAESVVFPSNLGLLHINYHVEVSNPKGIALTKGQEDVRREYTLKHLGKAPTPAFAVPTG